MFNIMGNMKGDGSVKRGSKSICGSIWNFVLVIIQFD